MSAEPPDNPLGLAAILYKISVADFIECELPGAKKNQCFNMP